MSKIFWLRSDATEQEGEWRGGRCVYKRIWLSLIVIHLFSQHNAYFFPILNITWTCSMNSIDSTDTHTHILFVSEMTHSIAILNVQYENGSVVINHPYDAYCTVIKNVLEYLPTWCKWGKELQISIKQYFAIFIFKIFYFRKTCKSFFPGGKTTVIFFLVLFCMLKFPVMDMYITFFKEQDVILILRKWEHFINEKWVKML